jgi:hypothetical protein
MHSDTDKMIAGLDTFNVGSRDDHAVSDLYGITENFDTLPDKARVIPSIFSVMERSDGADLGSPGPLVHCLESLGYECYLSQLVDSVLRQPTYLNVWMVNRILNSEIPDNHRQQLLDLLQSVSANGAASPARVAEAKGILARHAGRRRDN